MTRQFRPWRYVSLLILFATILALLPSYRTFAKPQRVQLSAKQVKQAMWVANWKKRTPLKAIKLEQLIETEFIARTAADEEDEIELQRRYLQRLGPRATDPYYRNQLSYDKIVRAMFDAAESMPIFQEITTKTWIDMIRYKKLERPVLDSLLSYTFADAVIDQQNTIQLAALDRAEQDPQFADTFDKTLGRDLGVSIRSFDPAVFLAEHPDFPVPQQIRDNIQSDGSVELSLEDLEAYATSEFARVDASIDDLQLNLLKIDAQQQDLVDFMKNEKTRQEAEALAQAKAQEHQLKLQAADTSIYIISTLAGFIDPKVGHQIETVGRSAIQVGESLNNWMEAVAGLNTVDKLSSLSTVVMTGNVLNAVMNVVGLFGSDQPSPDQMILEEIGKLRQQVDELRTEMHDRFDRVDEELNAIYTTMNDRFNQIDVQLGKLTVSLDEIQQSLNAISLDLSRIERDNFEFLDALGRRPLRDAINGAIGYKQRTGLDMPYQPDFVGYENTFQTWGTINAFDALSAGPTQRDYSDGQVLAELSAFPIDANLNYLNGWLSAHNMASLANKRLASPRDWTFASRAYADIGFDWPDHLKRIDPQRQAALDTVGNDLAVALRAISTIDTPNGPQGNTPLFNGIVAYYSTKLSNLNTAILSTENAFEQEVQLNRLQRGEPFDVFGGIDQPLAYRPADFTTMTCGGTIGGLAAPNNLKNIVPGYNRATLGDYMHLSTLTVCVSTEWVNEVEDCSILPGDQLPTCVWFASPQATITVYHNGVALVSSSYTEQSGFIPSTVPNYVENHWDFYKQHFEAQFANMTSPAPTAQLATTTSDLEARLAGYQQELFGRVVNGMNSGALRPAAVELAGAKKLLESFTTLGFPLAIDRDDFLRSLLFGDQQTPDDKQIIAAYTASMQAAATNSASTSATPLMPNPRLAAMSTAQKRRNALQELLTQYLSRISSGEYSEDNAMIANARFDMRFARSVANGDQPPPQAPAKHIHIPLAMH